MLLYKTQPKNSVENTVIPLSTKEKIVGDIRKCIPSYNGKHTKVNDVTSMVTDASILDAMIAVSGYENILVVPSFENNDYPKLRDGRYRPIRSAGDHLFPIVHTVNETHGNIYVAQPKLGNIFDDLYAMYDINVIHCDSWFKIDGSFHLAENDAPKFDAVVLLGNEGYKEGSFNPQAVKAKFARHCTDDFQLVDAYRGTLRRLTGTPKSRDNSINRVINAINTPNRIYTPKLLLLPEFKDKLVNTKDELLYRRLAHNIESINEWYKVY
jgi:hypothetical protein